ncbi:hypothetical protein V8J82_16380 [Gymnodinialimonas sp. 2305UL16-5]|uniref:hypothetical protein n=1 Tax=Gymnodinialimonas mytili TaxID=3126503 RepID=UPI0030A69BA6
MTISDEDLMAYADNALPEAERARIAAAVLQDPDLRARLEAFNRSRDLAQAAMPLEDVPDALQQRIQATIDAAADDISDADDPSISLAVPPSRSRNVLWIGALAASVVLGFGLGSTMITRDAVDPVAFDLAPFVSALDTVPSGAVAENAGIETRVVASFDAADGAFCREFEARFPDRTDLIGVGCRTESGWELRFAAVTELPGDDEFVPAGALDSLDAWMRSTGAGPVLSIEDEAARLSGATR